MSAPPAFLICQQFTRPGGAVHRREIVEVVNLEQCSSYSGHQVTGRLADYPVTRGIVMPRYFLHLRDSKDEVLDPEGVLMPPEAVVGAALAAARDCMAEDVRQGLLDLHYRIDVHDENGEIVHSLPFDSALEFAPAH
jgi:hypothetical protein